MPEAKDVLRPAAAPAPKPAPPPAAPFRADDPFMGDPEVVDPAEAKAAVAAAKNSTGKGGKAAVAGLPGAARRTPGAARRPSGSGAALVVAAVIGAAHCLPRCGRAELSPRPQVAYAGLGLPANRLELAIEGVKAQPTFEGGGRPALAVIGTIRNGGEHRAAASPPLRISLLDRTGKPVAAKVAQPLDAKIPAKTSRYFSITIHRPAGLACTIWRSPSRASSGQAGGKAGCGCGVPPRLHCGRRPAAAAAARPGPTPAEEAKLLARRDPLTPCPTMAEATLLRRLRPPSQLPEAEVQARVEALAAQIVRRGSMTRPSRFCLLTGGLWFCADPTRALSRIGRNIGFDALWLASYGDERASMGPP